MKLANFAVLFLCLPAQAAAAHESFSIPPVACGLGLSPIVRIFNLCDDTTVESPTLRLQSHWSSPSLGSTFNSLTPGIEDQSPGSVSTLEFAKIMPFLGVDRYQGAGRVTAGKSLCMAAEVEYIQQLADGKSLSATIPDVRNEFCDWVLTFSTRADCVTGIGINTYGYLADQAVVLETRDSDGNLLECAQLGRIYPHGAFPLHEKLPSLSAYAGDGTVRIIGVEAAAALDFYNGKLEQFRLPHPGVMG